MPLVHSGSKAAIGENIRRERYAGKPENQSIAIAFSEARKASGHANKLTKRANATGFASHHEAARDAHQHAESMHRAACSAHGACGDHCKVDFHGKVADRHAAKARS